ncbi:MAG: glucosamine-6-phosphate deaminase [Candidatus Woesearchaeota archaeon]
MNIIIARNPEELGKKAANIMREQLRVKKNSKILLPTGKTPLFLYKALVEMNRKKQIDFSKTKFFNLDEYVGAQPYNKESFNYYLRKNFFDKVNVNEKNISLLNGNLSHSKILKECKNYEKKLGNNIDLTFLGIGVDAHIAFNEPGTSFKTTTHITKLKKSTIKRNKIKFKKAITVGISTIMRSKKIVLLACGKEKVKAIRALLFHKINKNEPATVLRKHKDLTLIITKEIAKELKITH